jgi:hypothetical protein
VILRKKLIIDQDLTSIFLFFINPVACPDNGIPVKVGFQFVQYLKDQSDSTYDSLSQIAGTSKARVCQMVALCYRMNIDAGKS